MSSLPTHRSLRALLLVVGLFAVGLAAAPASTASAAVPALPAGTSKYINVSQTRIVDTRPSQGKYGFKRISSNRIRIKVTGSHGVPKDATAVVVNITATGGTVPGSITAMPTLGTLTPNWNVVTDTPNQSVSNLTTVKIGAVGSIDLFFTAGLQMTVDLVGAYVPVDGPVNDGRLSLVQAPRVAMDHRRVAPGSTTLVNLAAGGAPTTAEAVLVAITVDKAPKGFVTGFAYGKPRPNTATVTTSVSRQSRANQFIVPVTATNLKMRLYSSSGGELSVTVLGWFSSTASERSTLGLFVPAPSHRRLDTRPVRSLPLFGPVTFEFGPGVKMDVTAVAANVVTIGSWDADKVVARPAGVPSSGAPVNVVGSPRLRVAAHGLLRLSTRGVALSSARGAHMVVDVTGWYLGPRPTAVKPPVKNEYIAPSRVVAVRWTEIYPSGPRTHTAAVGVPATTQQVDLNPIADTGIAAAYRSRSMLGAKGNVLVFAHRTHGTGIFRGLNNIPVGTVFSLKSSNGHWFHYRAVGRHITRPRYPDIAAMATLWPPITAQLVACSKPDFTPTSTAYRIVITGELVGVD